MPSFGHGVNPYNLFRCFDAEVDVVGTVDANHGFNVGMASPLNVAVGVEAREDTYFIGAGDPASYYKEGPQSFTGYSPATAISKSRKNYAQTAAWIRDPQPPMPKLYPDTISANDVADVAAYVQSL